MRQVTIYHWFVGAVMVAVSGLTIAAPAEGRGIVADDAHFSSFTACDFAGTCIPFPLVNADGSTTKIYLYTNGIISVGKPLTNPPADNFSTSTLNLSTLGNSYLAPGLFNYLGSLGLTITTSYAPRSGLEFRWALPADDQFGVNLSSGFGGSITAVVMYGDGMTLPSSTLIGSSYGGCQTPDEGGSFCSSNSSSYDGHQIKIVNLPTPNFSYPNYVLTLPEHTRAIVADQVVPTSYHAGCALNKGIQCKPFLFQAHKFYIYSAGLVTVDTPLPITTLANITGANGPANIKTLLSGAPYVAVGLNDYSGAKLKLRLDTTDSSNPNSFTVSWSFPSGISYPKKKVTREAVFALKVDGNGPGGAIELTASYGAQTPSWFSKEYRNVVVCNEANCAPTALPIVGDYLPNDTLVASDMNGIFQDSQTNYLANTNAFSAFKYSNIAFPSLTVK